MTEPLADLEKIINSGLTTTIKSSEINFGQLFVEIDVENIISTIYNENLN